MVFFQLALLISLSSCALFKGPTSLENKDTEVLLRAVKATGEGKGRLTLGQSKYVFSIDSVLNENHDWILAVAIPLQGEEVMILRDLKRVEATTAEAESFESRIRFEFRQRGLDKTISPDKFLKELRSLVRFILSHQLGLQRECHLQEGHTICVLDSERYQVEAQKTKFRIKKAMGSGQRLEVTGKNLTDSFFSNTDFHLYIDENQKAPSFSLELFW